MSLRGSPFYAERGEDRKLVELLGLQPDAWDIGNGTYIDVGACDPETDSVTKYFYDRGWSGISIEPVPEYYDRLLKARPRDTNLMVAASDFNGFAEFTNIKGTGLSTFHPENAASGSNGREVEKLNVATLTLDQICRIYLPSGQKIDFLKIDVEGWEKHVIAGANWQRFRPRIVVVEATIPETDTPAWDEWEPLLLAADYEFIEFDGLNRWYRPSMQDRVLRSSHSSA